MNHLGWDSGWEEVFAALGKSHWYPARICRETKINYSVVSSSRGRHEVVLSGHLWHAAATDADLPTVGDWVAVDPGEEEDLPVVRALLPRRNRFSRKTPGRSCAEQVIGANVDCVVVVTTLPEDINLNRIERYLTLIRPGDDTHQQSGHHPGRGVALRTGAAEASLRCGSGAARRKRGFPRELASLFAASSSREDCARGRLFRCGEEYISERSHGEEMLWDGRGERGYWQGAPCECSA